MPQQPMKRPANTGEVNLFTKNGELVTKVVLPAGVQADVILWSGRCFVYNAGAYREATVFHSAGA